MKFLIKWYAYWIKARAYDKKIFKVAALKKIVVRHSIQRTGLKTDQINIMKSMKTILFIIAESTDVFKLFNTKFSIYQLLRIYVYSK